MKKNVFALFASSKTETISFLDLVEWAREQPRSRSTLLLPPIQRTVVWSNEQIINYWDSLLRGYPPGMMMVHPVKEMADEGNAKMVRTLEGKTQEANKDDYMLFDGQQRMAAILLAFGKGPLSKTHKLWVDFGTETAKGSGLKFQLRVSTIGQPFGYDLQKPNEKFELKKRQDKWETWTDKHSENRQNIQWKKIFDAVKGHDLIDSSECAVNFCTFCKMTSDESARVEPINVPTDPSAVKKTGAFVKALEEALARDVVLLKLDPELVGDQEEYIRFFQRVGQGGTRLSEDELTYSIIKHHYPYVHDSMQKIKEREGEEKQAGRLAGEVELVLAALRVAKAEASDENIKEWERIGRPDPRFVSRLKEDRNKEVLREFKKLIPLAHESGTLETSLKLIRNALAHDKNDNPTGFPAVLLGRLPPKLVEVLILFSIKTGTAESRLDKKLLCAFALHWLLFVNNNDKAASGAFRHTVRDGSWTFDKAIVKKLIEEIEKDGAARYIPRREALKTLRNQVEARDHSLRKWEERFTAADSGESKPGEALRVLSTDHKLIQRALLWLQREYLQNHFPNYDPTSERDDDLPIDLDHIVPRANFGFHWSEKEARLEGDAISENFREYRGTVGHSLGNFRWISIRENRARQHGRVTAIEGDLLEDADNWNELIVEKGRKRQWSKMDITRFQRLIDLRALRIYEIILTESGLEDLLPDGLL
ncbi:MAG TPA: DUF262 domain-containing protein [Candidatus Competibacter sp.]|nr:DUF262 domain-containing protein [Candidatus Competibacter sp.]